MKRSKNSYHRIFLLNICVKFGKPHLCFIAGSNHVLSLQKQCSQFSLSQFEEWLAFLSAKPLNIWFANGYDYFIPTISTIISCSFDQVTDTLWRQPSQVDVSAVSLHALGLNVRFFLFLTLLPGRNTEQPVKAWPKPAAREPCCRHSGEQDALLAPFSRVFPALSLHASLHSRAQHRPSSHSTSSDP